MRTRTYSELRRLLTFEERYHYLALGGAVGYATFGFDRHINQTFYNSREWRQIRHHVIARDQGNDLGMDGYDIHAQILIHHMNPITALDIADSSLDILDPECLITTTKKTHNAIHYGDESLLAKPFAPRRRGDTNLW